MSLSPYRIPFLIPYFVEMQRQSFLKFLNTGLVYELSRKNPMYASFKEFKISFYPEAYQLSIPEYTSKTAILKFQTYASKLYIPVKFTNYKTKELKLLWVLVGTIPLMTKRGHFIINGCPRVIVNQIVRSPGIYYKVIYDEKKRKSYYGDLISQRGAWLRLEIDKKKRVWVQMKKTRKIPILIFLKAIGISDIKIEEFTKYAEFLEISKDETEWIESTDYFHPDSVEDCLRWIYGFVYPEKKEKGQVTLKKAKKFLLQKFFNHRTYDLGYSGRNQLNKKFHSTFPKSKNSFILTTDDLLSATDYLIQLEQGIGVTDDIDDLKNRRVRTSGELLQNQLGTGFIRLEKFIKNKTEKPFFNILEIFSPKPVDSALREFFGSSPLSQFMDQTNPLAELTHKRRISSLGPGGVSRETAGMQVRGIHSSHYGRICPIETPEGRNAGLVNSLTTLARINDEGFIETPFYSVYQGQIQFGCCSFLSASHEPHISIAPGDLKINYFYFLPTCSIPAREYGNFQTLLRNNVQYMLVSPIQMISIATSLIPFLEHDDANRALMGSNMQRQAVPLILNEKPIVGTGLEKRVVSDSGHGLQAKISGVVLYTSSENIRLKTCSAEKSYINIKQKAKIKNVSRNFFKHESRFQHWRSTNIVAGFNSSAVETFYSKKNRYFENTVSVKFKKKYNVSLQKKGLNHLTPKTDFSLSKVSSASQSKKSFMPVFSKTGTVLFNLKPSVSIANKTRPAFMNVKLKSKTKQKFIFICDLINPNFKYNYQIFQRSRFQLLRSTNNFFFSNQNNLEKKLIFKTSKLQKNIDFKTPVQIIWVGFTKSHFLKSDFLKNSLNSTGFNSGYTNLKWTGNIDRLVEVNNKLNFFRTNNKKEPITCNGNEEKTNTTNIYAYISTLGFDVFNLNVVLNDLFTKKTIESNLSSVLLPIKLVDQFYLQLKPSVFNANKIDHNKTGNSFQFREVFLTKSHFLNIPLTRKLNISNLQLIIINNNLNFKEKKLYFGSSIPYTNNIFEIFQAFIISNLARNIIDLGSEVEKKKRFSQKKININLVENTKFFIKNFLKECIQLVFLQIFIKRKNLKHIFFFSSLNWQNFNQQKYVSVRCFKKTRYSNFFKIYYFKKSSFLNLKKKPIHKKYYNKNILKNYSIFNIQNPTLTSQVYLNQDLKKNLVLIEKIKTPVFSGKQIENQNSTFKNIKHIKPFKLQNKNFISLLHNPEKLGFSSSNLKKRKNKIYTFKLLSNYKRLKITKKFYYLKHLYKRFFSQQSRFQQRSSTNIVAGFNSSAVETFYYKNILDIPHFKDISYFCWCGLNNFTKADLSYSKKQNTSFDKNFNMKVHSGKIQLHHKKIIKNIRLKNKNQITHFGSSLNFFQKTETYRVSPYEHSNQNTCIHQTPLVSDREWVQKGDLLADGAASIGGELALGKSILVAYMPWEGYNFEDAILVSERLIYDDLYTSVHIEKYSIQISDTPYGFEQITNRRVNPSMKPRLNLDADGIIKFGTWVTQGDILVGKLTPIGERKLSGHEKLLADVLGMKKKKNVDAMKDTSLRVPKYISGRVVHIEKLENENFDNSVSGPSRVHIYIAEKKKIQVGDKMSGRHGNKGIISRILPRQDMPYLADGTPIDMVLNPLGVPSRMNVGQIFECLLGLAANELNEQFKISCFDEMNGPEASRSFTYSKLFEARLKTKKRWLFHPDSPGKMPLFDGRTGECFHQNVTVGRPYMLKLIHLVDEKIHARSTGPYSLVTQQPVRGRSKQGGQRLGEMEVWALEGFGAAYTLQELLTTKSDDIEARHQVMQAILQRKSISLGTPESFKVLLLELQSLCLHIGVYSISNSGNRQKIDSSKLF